MHKITFKRLPLENRYAVLVDGKPTGIKVWPYCPVPHRSLRDQWQGEDKHGRVKHGRTRAALAEVLVRMAEVPVKGNV